jgi:hypothetical protein
MQQTKVAMISKVLLVSEFNFTFLVMPMLQEPYTMARWHGTKKVLLNGFQFCFTRKDGKYFYPVLIVKQ